MAEPRFIKTVAFGGYEKEGVIKRIEFLNSQVHDLRNELRETKLVLESYKKGTEQEKALESVLAEERAKLTQVQVQNNTLNLKLKATDDENNTLQQQIKDQQAEIAELTEKLKSAETKCEALMAQDEATALSSVFIEAQKSSAMLESAAKSKAADIEAKTKELADRIIEDANVEAQQIIYDAEVNAAELISEAKNNTEQMEVATNNLRATALEDVNVLKEQVAFMESAFEALRNEGLERLVKAKELLQSTENKLVDGGVPIFKVPETYQPEIPSEKPPTLSEKYREDSRSEEDKRRKLEELEKLKHMAESIGSKKDEADKSADEKKASPAEPKQPEKPKADSGEKKGGKVDLAALAAKANSIGKK
jgi:predicted  nucleic acid-binding Zn-ribbon protein